MFKKEGFRWLFDLAAKMDKLALMSGSNNLYLEWIPSAYNDRPVKPGEAKAHAPVNPQQLIYGNGKPAKKPRYRALKKH